MQFSKATKSPYHAVNRRQQWTPGFSRLPWLGIAALFISLLGIAASIGILIASNNVSITKWKFQPTVYLSIASTVSNISLHFALTQGINVTWWTTALKGSTVADLHQVYDFSNNLWPAITSGRHLNVVAIACILVALSPFNGPLLQRASRVSVADMASAPSLQVPIVSVLPEGYNGYVSYRGEAVAMLTGNFIPVAQAWTVQQPIQLASTGCDGVFSTSLKGAGFAVNYSSLTIPFNMTPVEFGDIAETRLFGVDLDYIGPEYKVNIGMQYKSTDECAGRLQVQNCTLQGATMQYPVIINGKSSTISLDPTTTIWDDKVIDIMKGEDQMGNGGLSTLGGIFLALSNRFSATADMHFDGVFTHILIATGAAASQYADIPRTFNKTVLATNNCNLKYSNPFDDVLQGARELAFRTAIAAANASTVQHVRARQSINEARYESHYWFLFGAILLTVLPIVLITFLFQGYWHLGRRFTMSPIEIAKAFNAPLLRNDDSNAESTGLMNEVGMRPVRYGAVASEVSPTPQPYTDIVHTPTSQSYSSSVHMPAGPDDVPRVRLEINDPHLVLPPMPGWRFSG